MGTLSAAVEHGQPPRVLVRQDGGFGPHVRGIMRAVHMDIAWDGHRRLWHFPYLPASVYALQEAARLLGLELRLDPQLKQAQEAVLKQNAKEEQIRKLIQTYMDDPKLPLPEFTTQQNPPPWRHQQLAYHWAIRVSVLYLQHKMGLGKTREGADVLRGKYENGEIGESEQYLSDACPAVVQPLVDGKREQKILPPQWCVRGGVLVVAPRASMIEWAEQFWRWQGIQALPITSYSSEIKRELAGTPAWVHVCSYDSLELIERNMYDGIIADECHYLANDESNRFQRMLHLRKKARWVVGLSGTPQSNGIDSLWSQFFFLDGGRTLGPTVEAFRKRFLSKESREPGESPADKVARAISRISWPLSMQQAFPDKPQKIHKTVRVPMTKEQSDYYAKIRDQQSADILTGKVTLQMAMMRLMKLMQVTQGFVLDDDRVVQQFSSAKLTALEEMLKPGGELSDKRLIIWCRFKPEMAMILVMLKKLGLKNCALHGGLTDPQKQILKDSWNNDYTYRVMVGMIQMGIGLNLHAPKCVDAEGKPARVSTTVFYSLDWRVTLVEQAMDRVYRGDQVESCLYIYLLSDDLDSGTKTKKPQKPIDVRVYETLQAKIRRAKEVSETSVAYIRSLLGIT